MKRIDRRSALAFGLGGYAAAASGVARTQPQQAQPQQLAQQQRFAERVVEARLVLSFAAEPEAVRRWMPEGWGRSPCRPAPTAGTPCSWPSGTGCGSAAPTADPPPPAPPAPPAAAPAVWRYATLGASARARDDGRTGFAQVPRMAARRGGASPPLRGGAGGGGQARGDGAGRGRRAGPGARGLDGARRRG